MRTAKLVGLIKEMGRKRLVDENIQSRYSRTNRLAQEEKQEQETGFTATGQRPTPVDTEPEVMSVDGRR